MTGVDVAGTVEHAFRQERAAVLATLIRQVGDFQLAEDALQDAFASAVATWPRDGVPRSPKAWLTTTARRKAIDRIRRRRTADDRVAKLAELASLDAQEHPPRGRGGPDDGGDDGPDDDAEGNAVVDDRLRLIFTCCHPALNLPARVALTLRTLGGLTTPEIARAYLVPEATMAQRISRAKRRIAEAPLGRPGDLGTVLRVLYLIYNEGHSGEVDLATEAIRVTRQLAAVVDDPEVAPGLPRHTAASAYLHEKAGQLADAADLYAAAARAASNVAERDHLTRRAARLRQAASA